MILNFFDMILFRALHQYSELYQKSVLIPIFDAFYLISSGFSATLLFNYSKNKHKSHLPNTRDNVYFSRSSSGIVLSSLLPLSMKINAEKNIATHQNTNNNDN